MLEEQCWRFFVEHAAVAQHFADMFRLLPFQNVRPDQMSAGDPGTCGIGVQQASDFVGRVVLNRPKDTASDEVDLPGRIAK
jgi:hypothetical protein